MKCVQIVRVDAFFPVREAEVVGGAVGDAVLDAAAARSDRESPMVVVVAAPGCGGRSAELAAPDHQRIVEQAALLQVLQQGGGGAIDVAAQRAVL